MHNLGLSRYLGLFVSFLLVVQTYAQDCHLSPIYSGVAGESLTFQPMDWPQAPTSDQDWGNKGSIEYPYLRMSGQKAQADTWTSGISLPEAVDFRYRTFELGLYVGKELTWLFHLKDSQGRLATSSPNNLLANVEHSLKFALTDFIPELGFDASQVVEIQMSVVQVPAWTWVDLFLDNIQLGCIAGPVVPNPEASPSEANARVFTTKVEEKENYVKYAVRVVNTSSVSILAPQVVYLATAPESEILIGEVDYSNPTGVTVSRTVFANGKEGIVYILPGTELGAGQEIVFHTRIHRANYSNLSFSSHFSHQSKSGTEEANPFWSLVDASGVLVYGFLPGVGERTGEDDIWFDAFGNPQAVQPFSSVENPVVSARYFHLFLLDFLTAKELLSLQDMGYKVLEGQVRNGKYVYMVANSGAGVPLQTIRNAVSGVNAIKVFDASRKPLRRVSQDENGGPSSIPVKGSCFGDLNAATCEAAILSCSVQDLFQMDGSNLWGFTAPRSSWACLEANPSLRTLDEQVPLLPTNNNSMLASKLDQVQGVQLDYKQDAAPPLNWLQGVPYTGEGILVGVYDTGFDWTHPAFQEGGSDRSAVATDIKNSNPSSVLSAMSKLPSTWYQSRLPSDWAYWAHGNHVMGIIGANGAQSADCDAPPCNSSFRGVAPKARFYTSGTWFAGVGEVGHVTNHSHIASSVGAYVSSIDDPIFNGSWQSDQRAKTIVYAAANNGAGSQYGNLKGYYSILSNSKNALNVGNYGSISGLRDPSSSMGPTWDGRIKPDVMAPGSGTSELFYDPATSQSKATILVDYVKVIDHSSNAVLWSDQFVSGTGNWVDIYATSAAAVSDPSAEDGWAMQWNDYNELTSATYVGTTKLGNGFSVKAGDVIEVRYRVPAGISLPYNKLPGNIFFGMDPVGFYNKTCNGGFCHTMFPIYWEPNLDRSYVTTRFTIPSNMLTTPQTAYYFRMDLNQRVNVMSAVPSPTLNVANNPVPHFYGSMTGTSMAAPHATGVVALLLEKYRDQVLNTPACKANNSCKSLDDYPLRNSTTKALLIHSAEDMVLDAAVTAQEDVDVTDGMKDGKIYQVRQFVGPDFSTGWGKIDGKAALSMVKKDFFQEFSIGGGERMEWNIQVPPGLTRLRATLVWDDAPYTGNAPQTDLRLVNDLDLALVSPSGAISYPWRLDPPLAIPNTDGSITLGLEGIQYSQIKPAYRNCTSAAKFSRDCADKRNNVEVVDVDHPEVGTWKVVAIGSQVPTGNNGVRQVASLVCDRKLSSPRAVLVHPYPPNLDESYTYAIDGVMASVTFGSESQIGAGDYVYLTDANGNPIGKGTYSGAELQGLTLNIAGPFFTIRFVSDNNDGGEFGFSMDRFVVIPYAAVPLMIDMMKQKTRSNNP